MPRLLSTPNHSSLEPQQGRLAGGIPRLIAGTPHPSILTQKGGEGSGAASNLFNKWPIPLLLYLQIRVEAARFGTGLRQFEARLSPKPWVRLGLGIWPLQPLDLNSVLSKLPRECSDPSLFVLGRGVAVMLSAVELSINNTRDKELML